MVLSYHEARKLLDDRIRAECERRYILRQALLRDTNLLVAHLHQWAEDHVMFVADNAWVPDPQKTFGVAPDGLSPKGMIPFLLTAKHRELFRVWHETLDAPGKCDCAVDKTRQGACTSGFLWDVALHGFLFTPSTTGLLGSYADDVIDKGGKGQRDPTSLFGRLRMFLDAFMWNFSVVNTAGKRTSRLAFTHPKPQRGRFRRQQDEGTLAGMPDADDISYKLTRPRWSVEGFGELFPGAEGNWLQGALPGDDYGRSYSATWALLDEVDHYNSNIKDGSDRAAWAATNQNVRCRFLIGTPNRVSTATSLLKEKVHDEPSAALKVVHFDWCDLPFYMLGARWDCRECGHPNEIKPTETPGSGSMVRKCSGCLKDAILTRFDLTSPWLESSLARMKGDKAGIAAEIMRDWAGTQGNRLFTPWHASAIRRVELPPRDRLLMLEGFDPGTNIANPACWMLAALDTRTMRLHIVGYWMAADSFVEYWVPFIKRWSPEQVARMEPNYGLKSDHRKWLDAFDYGKDAMEMIRRVSERRKDGRGLVYPLGIIGGDKYGSHRNMMESPYERLLSYRIDVYEEYTSDRPALVRKGVEWSSRVTIDPEIADIMPCGRFPSLRQVFDGARTKPVTGQGEYKLDVDKQDPPDVSHAVDAFLYLTRLLDDRVRSVATVTGSFEQEGGAIGRGGGEPVFYGGDGTFD